MGFNDNKFISPLFKLFGKRLANVPPSPTNNDLIVFNSTSDEWELQQAIIGNAVQSSSNVGTGDGLALPRVLDDLPFKTLVDGVEIVITVSAQELTFSIGTIAISKITGLQVELDSKIETLTNVGGFNEIAKPKVGQNVDLRTLQAGTNVTITQNANDLEISATNTGEDNTASNVGTGVNVFLQKLGVDFEFRTLLANAEILITQNALDLAFSIGAIAQSKITGLVTALGTKIDTIVNVGTGAGQVFRDKVGTTLNLKTILAGTDISVTNNADDIEIAFTGTIPTVPPSFIMNSNNTEVANAGVDYWNICGIATEATLEVDRQNAFPNACTLRRMTLTMTQQKDQINTWQLRINGLDGNQVISIPASTTGLFQDLSNTDVISNGDLVDYESDNGGSGTFEVQSNALEVIA